MGVLMGRRRSSLAPGLEAQVVHAAFRLSELPLRLKSRGSCRGRYDAIDTRHGKPSCWRTKVL